MKKTLAALTIVALSGCVVPIPVVVSAPPNAVTTNDSVAVTSASATTDFTQALNVFRRSQGLGAVEQSAVLTRAATLHAQDMAARGYFSHSSPGGPNGANLMQRAQSAGCAVRAAAENIAQGQQTQQQVFESWRNSSGHRANMLGASYTSYGLGRAGDKWVLMFSSGC